MINAPFIAKIIAASLIPKLVHDSYIYCKNKYNEIELFSDAPLVKTIRKIPDNTKWTQFDYDVIMNKRMSWLAHNRNHPKTRISFNTLINDINYTLDLHKSHRAIATIWEGKVDRNSLAKGGLGEHKK